MNIVIKSIRAPLLPNPGAKPSRISVYNIAARASFVTQKHRADWASYWSSVGFFSGATYYSDSFEASLLARDEY